MQTMRPESIFLTVGSHCRQGIKRRWMSWENNVFALKISVKILAFLIFFLLITEKGPSYH